MGVTHIRYLLDQWRRRWETLAALHALEREQPASSDGPKTSPKNPGEDEAPLTSGPTVQ